MKTDSFGSPNTRPAQISNAAAVVSDRNHGNQNGVIAEWSEDCLVNFALISFDGLPQVSFAITLSKDVPLPG